MNRKCLFVVFILLSCVSGKLAFGQDSDDAQAIGEDVAEDFAIQGEYLGSIGGPAGEMSVGVQVISLGNGEFELVGYHGGLPGDGWDGAEPERFKAKLDAGEVAFGDDRFSGVVANKAIELNGVDGTQLGTLKKVERKSKTLGAKPPEGAVVLFDGTSTDNFDPASNVSEVRMTKDGLLMQGANSKHKHGDCHLHIEFRTPFMPAARGQQRGNSGVYLQGRYEVQVLDSFGLTGEQNECGGLYLIAKPNVNMCFPPMTWQTYDIDYVAAKFDAEGKKTENARMTVKHNGVLIHDDVELPQATTASPNSDSPETGFLHLQDHGNPVCFRNIWMTKN